MDRWSAGTLENSILNAYLHTIRESRHFLYIEVCRSEGGAEKLRISCQWAQSLRAGIAGPGELGEALTQGREPGDGDGNRELRAGTADGGRTADVCHWSLLQNQFFISCSDGRTVLNKVGDEIVDRILKAHK